MSQTSDAHTGLHQRTVVAVLRAAAAIRREVEAVTHAQGITGQQYNVLRILRGAVEAGEGPLPTMAVAARMIEAEPGITRMMGRLEAKGLIQRVPSPEDGRQKRCALTQAGHRVVDALDAPVAEANARLAGSHTAPQLKTLIELLGGLQPEPAQ